MKNIFLIGFMGSGKSYLARELAKEWARPLIETDEQIEKEEGKTIADIFSQRGENYFRQKETELLKKMSATAGAIVSVGGGIVLRQENTNLMQQKGAIVFIDTPFEMCYGRITGDKNRPLAQDKTQQQMFELFLLRRMVYLMAADEVIDGVKDASQKIAELNGLKEINKW